MAGGVFSGAKLFAMKIRESATDGSDFSNPDTDYRMLFLGEDGLLHVKDSAGSVTNPYTGGFAGATLAEIFYTSGDISVTSTTAGTAIPTLSTLSLAGAAGDIFAVSLSTRCTDTDAQSIRIDAKLTGSASRFLSSRTSTADNLGQSGWFVRGGEQEIVSGTIYITTVSADFSAGSCTITLCTWLSAAGNRPLSAGTNGPLHFQAVNLG